MGTKRRYVVLDCVGGGFEGFERQNMAQNGSRKASVTIVFSLPSFFPV